MVVITVHGTREMERKQRAVEKIRRGESKVNEEGREEGIVEVRGEAGAGRLMTRKGGVGVGAEMVPPPLAYVSGPARTVSTLQARRVSPTPSCMMNVICSKYLNWAISSRTRAGRGGRGRRGG